MLSISKKNYLKLKIMQEVPHFLGFFISTNPCGVNIYDTVSVNFGDAVIRFHAQAVKSVVCLSEEVSKAPAPFQFRPFGQIV